MLPHFKGAEQLFLIMKKITVLLLVICCVGVSHLAAQKKNGEIVEKKISSAGNYVITANYKLGVLDGPFSEIYEKAGKVKSSGQYSNGKKAGQWEYGKSDGSKTFTEVYDAPGSLSKKITYYTNGKPQLECDYKNDKYHGVVRKYDSDGSLKSEGNFVGGKEHGKQTQYFVSTSMNYVCISHYQDGRKDGEYLEEYKNGKIKVKGQYKQDKKDGVWVYGESSGKLGKEETYADGKLLGTKKL